MLLLNDFAFGDFNVVAGSTVGINARAADGNNAHLDRDQAAVNFNALKGEVHVGLAAEEWEILGFLDGADDAVNAGAGGKNDAAVKGNGLRENRDEWIAFVAGGAADGSEQREMNFGALDDLAGFRVSGENGRNGQGKN